MTCGNSISKQNNLKLKEMKRVILDNGHGKETAGKRSPEWNKGVLYEYEFNRDIVKRIAEILEATGVPFEILAPETEDVSLSSRVKRANEIYQKDKSAYLVSIHANAGGGVGYELFTSPGKTKSDEYAKVIYDEVHYQFKEWRMRGIKEDNFYILKKTSCPAILCELGFMDNADDYERLMSDEFRNRLAIAHANAIIKISRA